MKSKSKAGQKLGPWTLAQSLGGGGNGEVWSAENPEGELRAIKILKPTTDKERIGRFDNEISFLKGLGTFPGVVPLIDRYRDIAGPRW